MVGFFLALVCGHVFLAIWNRQRGDQRAQPTNRFGVAADLNPETYAHWLTGREVELGPPWLLIDRVARAHLDGAVLPASEAPASVAHGLVVVKIVPEWIMVVRHVATGQQVAGENNKNE